MAIQLSPGVQVVEKDYTQIVPSVSTSTGAFAGVFKWGPVEEPTVIGSESDLVTVFGKPNDSNYESFFTAKNFLDYSKQMYVTRVDTAQSRNAVAVRSGKVSAIKVTLPGSGYTAAPNVTLTAPAVADGSRATAVAVLSGGPVTSYTIVNGGSGYSVGDIVRLSKPEQTVDTSDANGNIISRTYTYASAIVTAVSGTGSITTISFEEDGASGGDGYIVPSAISYSIKNSGGNVSSSGTGANITFGVQASSIKSITIANAGSGYTETQTIAVTIEVDPDQQSSFTGVNATATAEVTAGAAKIRNKTDYETNWFIGQGTYGEFAAKYPGTTGNSLSVSMCDAANWSTRINGTFLARKTIEAGEDERELSVVRRVIANESSFSNDDLDAGKILRSINGDEIGEIRSIIETVNYRLVVLSGNTNYNVQLNQHVRASSYGAIKNIAKIARTTGGIVTITTTEAHGLEVGQFITVQATQDQSVNVVNQIISAATNTTFSYYTSNFTEIVETTDAGAVQSQSMGVVDGFVKEWDEVDDAFKLSRRGFIVTVADETNHDWAVGQTLVDASGAEIGAIESVEQVQTIILANNSKVDVYGSDVTAEWKYKSMFNNNAPGTSAYAVKENGANDELHVVVIDRDGRISGNAGAVLEQYANVSKASDARNSDGTSNYYKDIVNAKSNWIWVLDHSNDIEASEAKSNWGVPAQNANFKLLTNAVVRDLNGGVDTTDPTAANYINAYTLYQDATAYDISLMPIGSLPASTAKTIIQTVAENRKDLVVFLSAPLNIGTSSDIATGIVTYRDQLPSSSYAVMDSGYKYQYDKYADKFRWIPLAGDVAGLCAYTDNVADPWYSPGGFNRGQIKNVTKLAFNPTLEQRDTLYKSGVNPVVTFPGEGTVLYGDKTLQTKASAFDRINVRRLFIILEKAIAKASKYQLFEFNDDFTRAQFRALVEPFLRDVQGRRGIVDFLVKCDTSNNTPQVIDSNEFVADIYIKPNRSINFITLNFIATKTGVNFDEIGA